MEMQNMQNQQQQQYSYPYGTQQQPNYGGTQQYPYQQLGAQQPYPPHPDDKYRRASSNSSLSHAMGDEWSKEDQLGFIRKVYGILGAQLLFTAFICLLPYLSDGAKVFFLTQYWLALTCAIAGLILACCLFCVPSLARSVPTNYCLMGVFTFCEAYVVGFVCAAVGDAQTVLAAAFFTAGIVVGLTIYAMTTKTDFTFCGGMMFVVGAAFVMFGLFSVFLGPTARMIYCLFGVILFGIYLIIDTQMIVGNKRYHMDKEDYILGAIMLYLDIINIFLYILQLLSSNNN